MKLTKMLMLLAIAGLAFAGQLELSIQEESHDPLWAKPRILIANHSDVPTELHRLRVHYRVDPSEQAMAEIFSPFGYSVSITQQADGSGYAEIDLRGKVLQPGDSWNWGNGIQLGLHNSSWAPWRSALVDYLVSLHDPFGDVVAGTEPSFSSSSAASLAELEVIIKETSDDPQWSKPRIQIKNKGHL